MKLTCEWTGGSKLLFNTNERVLVPVGFGGNVVQPDALADVVGRERHRLGASALWTIRVVHKLRVAAVPTKMRALGAILANDMKGNNRYR